MNESKDAISLKNLKKTTTKVEPHSIHKESKP